MIIKLDGLGRFVLPKIIREALGVKPNGELKIELVDDKLIITKPKSK